MKLEELNKYAEQEASWLRYYGNGFPEERIVEKFEDAKFYDRITSIGYTKRVIPLSNRCAAYYITADKPVLECELDELIGISGPRNHEENIYTALEYSLAKNVGNHEEFRKTLHS